MMKRSLVITIFLSCFFNLVAEYSYSDMNGEKKTQNLTISEQLAYSTVKIDVEYNDGSRGSGTGFFFRFKENDNQIIPLIITNKHVINNANKGYIYMTLADENGNPKNKAFKKIEIKDFEKSWILH